MPDIVRAGRPIRVLHCPENVGGHPSQLAAGERAIGLSSWCLTMVPHPFGYPADEIVWSTPPGRLRKLTDRVRIVWRALRDFDVVHFNFGQTLFPARPLPSAPRRLGVGAAVTTALEMRDAELLRRRGKVIAVTFQGDDARQGDVSRRLFDITAATEVEQGYYTNETDEEKRRRIRRFDRVAHRIYALNPDLLHVLPSHARFMPYASVNVRDWSPVPRRNSARPVVVHAPSHRGAKGTRHVIAAIERLRADGVDVDFRLIEGMPRDEARRHYEEAHLLIDQLLIGWYGGLAVELMALGKPVVCYIRDADLRFIPDAMRQALPIIRATPGNLYEVLKATLGQGLDALHRMGETGRRFVERWHDPIAVAGMHARDYEELVAGQQLEAAV